MNQIKSSTAVSYGKKYRIFAEDFCRPKGLSPFPATLETVMWYVGWRRDKGTVGVKF